MSGRCPASDRFRASRWSQYLQQGVFGLPSTDLDAPYPCPYQGVRVHRGVLYGSSTSTPILPSICSSLSSARNSKNLLAGTMPIRVPSLIVVFSWMFLSSSRSVARCTAAAFPRATSRPRGPIYLRRLQTAASTRSIIMSTALSAGLTVWPSALSAMIAVGSSI